MSDIQPHGWEASPAVAAPSLSMYIGVKALAGLFGFFLFLVCCLILVVFSCVAQTGSKLKIFLQFLQRAGVISVHPFASFFSAVLSDALGF